MKYYAHTCRNLEGETLFSFRQFPGERLTAQDFADRNAGRRFQLSDLADDQAGWQLLSAHLANVAERARKFAEPFGLEEEANLSGLLHDLGKYAARFQQRLKDPRIHHINHWSIGAFHAWQVGCRLAAWGIEGHHTGMPALNSDHDNLECWKSRFLKLNNSDTAPHVSGFPESADEIIKRYENEGFLVPASEPPLPVAGREFFTAFLIRMIFSCLVDADFLDTEHHFSPGDSSRRKPPALECSAALEYLQVFLKSKPANGDVNRFRRALLQDCLAAALRPPGLFTLTAPTGSGKTLSSLAFALKHIEHHNATLNPEDPRRLRRIIVVIPYTSIIDQTAAVYRAVFEKHFGLDYVLEHHCAVLPHSTQGGPDGEDLSCSQVACENWDAPIVVTTSVQFFESLFSHRPAACRKLHNLARSVILFDEVQTLPRERIPSLLSAVSLLAQEPCGATSVLMTATQPAFTVAASSIQGGWKPTEISSAPSAMAEGLNRVEIIHKPNEWRPTWPDVASAVKEDLQVLIVVNTKASARELFQALRSEHAFHLSTALCPAHRHEQLAEIRRRLADRQPCRLVSTQLIEAGVDVDFPVVWRARGPLDSIIQSAGRCNREGRLSHPGKVVVFRPAEHRMPPGPYGQAAAVTEAFLAQRRHAPLHQPETYAAYFHQLYSTCAHASPADDPVFKACCDFDFPAATAASKLIGNETRGVLVPWGEGNDLIEAVRTQFRPDAALLRRCQRFTVNLYLGEFAKAERDGVITPISPDKSIYAWTSKYDEHLGATHHSPDDLIL